jgi:hypothetical protein
MTECFGYESGFTADVSEQGQFLLGVADLGFVFGVEGCGLGSSCSSCYGVCFLLWYCGVVCRDYLVGMNRVC